MITPLEQLTQPLKLRPLVVWFAQEMERVLQENDFKHGWQTMSNDSIYDRQKDELRELGLALASGHANLIINKAVDVANFCAFMAWNEHRKGVRYET